MMIILLVDHLKKDFFYQLNGKVVPYILGKYGKFSKRKVEKKVRKYNKILLHHKKLKHDNLEYNFESYNWILFIYKLFGKRAIIRRFNHNAIS